MSSTASTIGSPAASGRRHSAKPPIVAIASATPPLRARAKSKIATNARRLGSKADQVAYKTIINQMPPHSVYVEPFLGWGAVLFHKRPSLLSIGLDKDAQRIQDCWSGHGSARRIDVEELLWRQQGAQQPAPEHVPNSRASMPRDCHLLCVADAFDFLTRYPWRGDELIYCDPPYPKETRTSDHEYLFELSPDPERDQSTHAALLALLKTLPCKVMLSSYYSALYAIALKEWRMVTYTGVTRGGPREECLWMNYPQPVELHDYRFLGKNFRERQDIKRLKQRWIKRLAAMPPLKRQAMLAAIQESSHG